MLTFPYIPKGSERVATCGGSPHTDTHRRRRSFRTHIHARFTTSGCHLPPLGRYAFPCAEEERTGLGYHLAKVMCLFPSRTVCTLLRTYRSSKKKNPHFYDPVPKPCSTSVAQKTRLEQRKTSASAKGLDGFTGQQQFTARGAKLFVRK